jgi:hypothetical protein
MKPKPRKKKAKKAPPKKRGNKPGSNGGGGAGPKPDPFTSKKELEKLKDYAKSGIRVEDIAAIYHMAKSTLYNLMKSNPAIRLAIDEGRATALHKIGKSLFDRAIEGDLTAQIFYLKTQGGWRDKSEDAQKQGMQSVRIVLPGQKSEQVVSIGPPQQMTTIDVTPEDGDGTAE